MKNWLLYLALLLISIQLHGDITQSEKIPIRVNNDKTTEAQMLFSDARFYLGRLKFSPGGAVPEHNHAASTETVYILAGSGELTLSGKKFTVKTGDVVHIPIGANHAFRNNGSEPVDLIQVYSPPGPEERFTAWTIKE